MKKVIFQCRTVKSISDNIPVYVNGMLRCPACKQMEKIINVIA